MHIGLNVGPNIVMCISEFMYFNSFFSKIAFKLNIYNKCISRAYFIQLYIYVQSVSLQFSLSAAFLVLAWNYIVTLNVYGICRG